MFPNLNFFRKKGCYSRALILIVLSIDFWSFVGAYKIAALHPSYISIQAFATYAFISALAWIITACCYQLYTPHKMYAVNRIVNSHLEALPLLALLLVGTFSLLRTGTDMILPLLILNCYGLAFTLTAKAALLVLYKQLHRRHKIRYVIIGHSAAGRQLHQYLRQHKQFSYQFMGFFDDHHPHLVQGMVEDACQFCIRNDIHQIYLAIPDNPDLTRKLAAFADDHYIYFGYLTDPHPLQEGAVLLPKTHLIPLPVLHINYQTYYL